MSGKTPVVPQRASDADRDDAITKLNNAFTLGYLTQEERDERVALAFNAKTEEELPPLLADIAKMAPPPVMTNRGRGASLGPPQLEVYRQQIAELAERVAERSKVIRILLCLIMLMIVLQTVHPLFGVH